MMTSLLLNRNSDWSKVLVMDYNDCMVLAMVLVMVMVKNGNDCMVWVLV
jgi:hypothetical protein